MPRNKRQSRGRLYRAGKFAMRHAPTALNAMKKASQAYAAVLAVKNLLNVEFKNHDVNGSWNAMTNPDNSSLVLMNQGDSATTYDGRSIKVTSLLLKGAVKAGSVATVPNRVRLICAIDKQPNGTAADISVLLQNQTDIDSPRQLAYSKRYHVLFDRVFNIIPGTDKAQYQFKYYFRLSDKIKFNGTAGTVADLATKNIFLYSFAETTAGSPVQTPDIIWDSRIRFVDN